MNVIFAKTKNKKEESKNRIDPDLHNHNVNGRKSIHQLAKEATEKEQSTGSQRRASFSKCLIMELKNFQSDISLMFTK